MHRLLGFGEAAPSAADPPLVLLHGKAAGQQGGCRSS
jgi:hypothetical protein